MRCRGWRALCARASALKVCAENIVMALGPFDGFLSRGSPCENLKGAPNGGPLARRWRAALRPSRETVASFAVSRMTSEPAEFRHGFRH